MAGLGGNADSVLVDANEWHGTVQSSALDGCELREISLHDGTRLREFVNRGGGVFAVAWQGPLLPDLKRLLGTGYAAYAHMLAGLPQPGLRRSLRWSTSDLVIESAGHLRSFSGLAYLPSLIPPGLSPNDLR